MKNIIISFIALLIVGCKATQVQTVTIDASKEDVWKVVSALGDISNYGGLDSSSLTPSGEATLEAFALTCIKIRTEALILFPMVFDRT